MPCPYVALPRHRDSLQLHYGRDDFDDLSKLTRVLSRERAKDMVQAALAALTTEWASVPDDSETLGEIAKGVAVARMGRLATSQALTLTPAEMAR